MIQTEVTRKIERVIDYLCEQSWYYPLQYPAVEHSIEILDAAWIYSMRLETPVAETQA